MWRDTGTADDLVLADLTGLRVSLNPAGIHDETFGLTSADYQTLLQESLEGVPEARVENVRGRLAIIDPLAASPKDSIDWIWAMNHAAPEKEFQAALLASLTETACKESGAPFVAQGTVDYRIRTLGPSSLPLLEKLLDPDGRGCPAAKGLGSRTVAYLKDLKAQYTPAAAASAPVPDAAPTAVPSRK